MKYKQVDCGFYDRLEELSIKNEAVEIEYSIPDETPRMATGVIRDLFILDQAEYLKLNDGTIIRIDLISNLKKRFH